MSQSESFWNDPQNAKVILKEQTQIKNAVEHFSRIESEMEDVSALVELGVEDEELLREGEIKLKKTISEIEQLELKRMLSHQQDINDAIVQISAGAGGTEACDWASMLLRMYQRWADQHGYKSEIIDYADGDGAGFRNVVLTVSGDYAYGYLKAENGVHRLVRISPFDANKRRHTSFAAVYVMPDIEDEVEIEIVEADLKVDTFRAGGAGGQHVNKTDSAVRMTHMPTGIVVASQSQRSQHQNRANCMKLLKAKLYELEMEKKRKERDIIEENKSEISWGSQIRSYVLQPYQMVKDHRTNVEIGNSQAVLDGEIDPFIREFLIRTAR